VVCAQWEPESSSADEGTASAGALAERGALPSLVDVGGASGDVVRTSPDALHDLALDEIFDRLASTRHPGRRSLFETPLGSEDAVRYRQDVFRDLQRQPVREAATRCATSLTTARRLLTTARSVRRRHERDLWHLHGVLEYARAVDRLEPDLRAAGASSLGMRRIMGHAARLTSSSSFVELRRRSEAVAERLGAVTVSLVARDGRVSVGRFDDEADLLADARRLLGRLVEGGVEKTSEQGAPPMGDWVQSEVLERAARLFPEVVADLATLAADFADPLDPVLDAMADDLSFYLSYLDLLAPLREAGLPICFPEVSSSSTELDVGDTYDLALGVRLVADGVPVVLNDVSLHGRERLLVISGPNQGGKTTMCRTFGQLHHLAAIGCPVPGTRARVHLADRILTQFDRDESEDSIEGRLGEDVRRMHRLTQQATARSVVVLNEMFSSTTLDDARFLTTELLARLRTIGVLVACVSFIDEISRFDAATVSMVATIEPGPAATRTFHLVRGPSDGRAYARTLALRYGLTADQLRERIATKGDVP